jgi:hypothetical protein
MSFMSVAPSEIRHQIREQSLFKVVDSQGGTPTDSHTAPSFIQCFPSHGTCPIGSGLKHVTHFGGVCSKVLGTLTEGGELTYEAIGEYSLTIDAPPGPGSALLLDVGNEGRIRDQLVE